MGSISTFSIVARQPDTGELGVATASKFLAVGAVVPHAAADVGAVATQSLANVTYGPRTLAALREGRSLASVHAQFEADDPDHALRQYGLVDARGDAFTHTGADCHPWAGGRTGEGYAVQGNLLVGPEVIDAMVAAFEASTEALPERLMAALRAGDEAGGDRRGRQAAALLVVRAGAGYGGGDDRAVDLRVDDDPAPVARLAGLLSTHRLLFAEPDPDDLLAIEGTVEARLRAVLRAAGHDLAEAGGWGASEEAALRAVASVENLEARMTAAGTVDRRVLEYLERARPAAVRAG